MHFCLSPDGGVWTHVRLLAEKLRPRWRTAVVAVSRGTTRREVFQEAAKDECFGAAARREILAHPGRWLAKMPAKLHATFDYFGAAPWYLHDANSAAFGERAKRS